MRRRTGFPQNAEVYCFPLACWSDVSALSRFVHHVLDWDLCTADTVVVVASDQVVADRCALGVLNVAIGRLATRHVLTIVVSRAYASLAELGRATYPNFAATRFVASEGEAAHLILDGVRLPR